MSQEDIGNVKRAYDALNAAYRSGDVNDFLPVAEEIWDPAILFCLPGGAVGATEVPTWRGRDAMLRFFAFQMERYGQLWMQPQEFIETGEHLIVPVRFGGRDLKTGTDLESTAVHVISMSNGKALRVEAFETMDQARQAARQPE
jgi:ketosteroid isomerase-like protein